MPQKIFKNENSIIEIKDISKKYGQKQVLRDINFVIKKNDKIYLSGENGVGKTTLLKIIAALIRPDNGEVTFDGILLNNDPKLRSNIGYMTTELMFYEMLSLYDNLTLVAALYKLKNVKLSVDEIVKKFNMTSYQHNLISGLSSGMKRKFQIAGAMIHHPEFLILDEPFNTLDQNTIKLVLNLLKNYTVIFTSHDANLAHMFCTKEINIKNGSIHIIYKS